MRRSRTHSIAEREDHRGQDSARLGAIPSKCGQNTSVTGGIEIDQSHHPRRWATGPVRTLTNGYGIYLAAPNNLIDRCDIYDNNGAGIMLYNDDGALPTTTLSGTIASTTTR